MQGEPERIVILMKIAGFMENPSLKYLGNSICRFRNVRFLLLFHIERITIVMIILEDQYSRDKDIVAGFPEVRGLQMRISDLIYAKHVWLSQRGLGVVGFGMHV